MSKWETHCSLESWISSGINKVSIYLSVAGSCLSHVWLKIRPRSRITDFLVLASDQYRFLCNCNQLNERVSVTVMKPAKLSCHHPQHRHTQTHTHSHTPLYCCPVSVWQALSHPFKYQPRLLFFGELSCSQASQRTQYETKHAELTWTKIKICNVSGIM